MKQPSGPIESRGMSVRQMPALWPMSLLIHCPLGRTKSSMPTAHAKRMGATSNAALDLKSSSGRESLREAWTAVTANEIVTTNLNKNRMVWTA
jgi:hypothetical protein